MRVSAVHAAPEGLEAVMNISESDLALLAAVKEYQSARKAYFATGEIRDKMEIRHLEAMALFEAKVAELRGAMTAARRALYSVDPDSKDEGL
jgi:putative heme iron utilization protein